MFSGSSQLLVSSALMNRKNTAQSCEQPSPCGILSPPELANSHQLEILSALQGNDFNFLSRATVADAIMAIESDRDKMELIDFIASEEQSVIASTLENNACKQFNCTPAELPLASRQYGAMEFLAKLADLFSVVLHKIIPNLFAMLYPLQQFDAAFRIRPIILHHFRNRVLIRALNNFEFEWYQFERDLELERTLRQMFGLINIEIDDNDDQTEESERFINDFNRIYGKFLGQPNAENENDDKADENERITGDEFCRRRKMGTIMLEGEKLVLLSKLSDANVLGRHCSLDDTPLKYPDSDIIIQPKLIISGVSVKLSAHPTDLGLDRYRKQSGNSKAAKVAKTPEGIRAETMDKGRKARARTMPSTKSVSFWDEESAADV